MKRARLFLPALILLFLISGFLVLRSLYVVPVMMYHNIAAAQNDKESANSVSPASFLRHMEFLKERGYRVLSLDEYVDGLRRGERFCCKSAVITFDDGIENNYTQALPVLEKNNFPAAFFIGVNDTGAPGQMTWSQMQDAAARGITIGSHLMNEAYLPDIAAADQVREIAGSKKAIEDMLRKPVHYLAYPIGGFSDEIKTIVQQAGYRAAFATNRGADRFNRDLFELKRIRFKDSDTDLVLWMKLSGYYNLIRKSKASH